MKRYALRDDQWERIEDLLPGRKGCVGCNAKDNRLFVEAVLYRYRAGILWRDLPERFGGRVVNRYLHGQFEKTLKTVPEPKPHPIIILKFIAKGKQ